MFGSKTRLRQSAASISLICGLASPAFAQEAQSTQEESPVAASAEAADPAATQGGLEEIVVTAQRRSERLQDVPIAISAFTAETLESSGITGTSELQMVTPGLTFTATLSSANPYLRGVGTNDINAGNENSNATYVDGIYYPSMPGVIFSFLNIERIEVLKGPQGTLFGRNASGGLVHVITRDPAHEFGFEGRVGYANYDTFEASGYVTGGLSSNLAADMSVYYSDQGKGWGRNLNTGDEVNSTDVLSLRSKWQLELGDTRLTLSGDYTDRASDVGVTRQPLAGSVGADRVSRMRGTIYDFQGTATPFADTTQGGLALRAETDIGFARLVSLTGWRKLRTHLLLDQDNVRTSILNLNWDAKDESLTQEIQLLSEGGGPLQWIVGGFYMDRHSQYDPLGVFGGALPPFMGGGFNLFSDLDTRSIAGFAQATYQLMDDTSFTAGVRYTSDRQHFNARQISFAGAQLAVREESVTYNKFTWRFALDHKITPDILLYGTVSRGFKAGIYNISSITAPTARPETLDAYEAGLKSDFLDRRLRINVAGFYYNYQDIQLQKVEAGASLTLNAADSKIYGMEIEATAIPIEGLTLQSGLSWLPKAEYVKFPGAPISSRNPLGGNIVVSGDASGNRMVRAPKATFNASVNYNVPAFGGEVDFNLTYYHSSSYFWEPDNRIAQGAHDLVNAQIGWTAPGGQWDIRLWAKNLTDTEYFLFVGTAAVGDSGAAAAPRTYGASVGFRF
jgi:iron complex outermembrane receptor protein